jgi:hypothetical protein
MYPEQIQYVEARADELGIKASQLIRELVTLEQETGGAAGAIARRARAKLRKHKRKKRK